MSDQVRKIRSHHNPDFVSPDGYDLCVLCGAVTLYKTETPVDERSGYMVIGQTCPYGCKPEVIPKE